jgi:hypothetical protein
MVEVASRRAIVANHLTILVPVFARNNQRFVNEHSNQPAPKSALVVELRRIARSCKPTLLDSMIGSLGIAENTTGQVVQ